VRAVLITGPPGSGKTSVLTALSDALSDDGVAHAALEVEAIVGTHPALDEDARLRHVRVNCALLRKAGPELLVVGDTVETSAELAALREAVGADEVFVVRLRAEPDTLAERIIAREPPGWSGLDALVEHARAMSDVPGADLVLCTEGETAEAVAARIRETARL
jgi:broad-specificity NMP kinase